MLDLRVRGEGVATAGGKGGAARAARALWLKIQKRGGIFRAFLNEKHKASVSSPFLDDHLAGVLHVMNASL